MTPAAPQTHVGRIGGNLLLAGVVLAVFGTPVAMLPGGYSAFGPVKLLALLAGVLLIAAGLTLAPEPAARAATRVLRTQAAWPGLALVALAVLATATSAHPLRSLTGAYPEYRGLLLLLASAVAGFGSFALSRNERFARVLTRSAVIALALVCAYALAQAFGLDPVRYGTDYIVRRVRSTLGNGSSLGVFLLMATPLAVAAARRETGTWRTAAWATSAAGLVTLALTLSRGAWFGALVALCVWLLAEGRTWEPARRRRIIALATACAVTAVALTTLAVPNASSRLAALANPTSGTVGWRLAVWPKAAQLAAQRPLLGYGPASFAAAFTPQRTAAMVGGEGDSQVLDDPHNILLSAALGGGALAAIALVTLLGAAIASPWKSGGSSVVDLALLSAALAGGLSALSFHFMTLDTAPLMAVLIGATVGSYEPVPEREPAPRRRLAQLTGVAIALCAALGCVAAFGLLVADRDIGVAFALPATADMARTDALFSSASRLAPWEPAVDWARMRVLSRRCSATRDPAAAAAIPAAAQSTLTRLAGDPLATAQAAEAYLVASQVTRSEDLLERARATADLAIGLDPENGNRWGIKGAVALASGDLRDAREAYERAVRYSPGDASLWNSLEYVYRVTGDASLAATARRRAAELPTQKP